MGFYDLGQFSFWVESTTFIHGSTYYNSRQDYRSGCIVARVGKMCTDPPYRFGQCLFTLSVSFNVVMHPLNALCISSYLLPHWNIS